MYKLSVVDDEPVILERITQMIEKLQPSVFTLESTFNNGDDAYNQLSINPPDILITDIEIPFINGLQLVRQLKRSNPLLKVIIITGYDQIDYAKEAIDLGVVGFISKPITIDELQRVLNKAQLQIEQESHVELNIQELAQFFRHNVSALKENHLVKLTSLEKVSANYIEQLHKIGLFLDYKYMRMVSYDFDLVSEENDLSVIWSFLNKEINDLFNKKVDFNIFEKEQKLYTLLKFNEDIDKEIFIDNLNLIISKLDKYLKIKISIGLSSLSIENHMYKKIFNESNIALSMRRVFGGTQTFTFTDLRLEQSEHDLFDQTKYDAISYKVKYETDILELNKYFESIRHDLSKENKNYNLHITNILNSIIKAVDSKLMIDGNMINFNDLYEELFKFKTLDDLTNWFYTLSINVQKSNMLNIENRIDYNMDKIISYISNHYDDKDLNLDTLSEAMNYSVSYITSLFKKIKNTTFVKYLTSVRMEHAKDLLEKNYKVIEVSSMVGFNEPYYFSHCFKKYYGLSPKEYKDEHIPTEK